MDQGWWRRLAARPRRREDDYRQATHAWRRALVKWSLVIILGVIAAVVLLLRAD